MKITREELDEFVRRAVQALEGLDSVVEDLIETYAAEEQSDGTPIDIALFLTAGDSDIIRDVITDAIEAAEQSKIASEDDADNWKYN